MRQWPVQGTTLGYAETSELSTHASGSMTKSSTTLLAASSLRPVPTPTSSAPSFGRYSSNATPATATTGYEDGANRRDKVSSLSTNFTSPSTLAPALDIRKDKIQTEHDRCVELIRTAIS